MPAELKVLLRARYPLVWLDTPEEERAVQIICDCARQEGESVAAWSQILGIHDVPGAPKPGSHTDVIAALGTIRKQEHQFWILKDIGGLVQGTHGVDVARALRETARQAKEVGAVIVCVGNGWCLPRSLAGDAAQHTLTLPERRDHISLLNRLARELGSSIASKAADKLGSACVGLTLEQAENIWARVHALQGRFDEDAVDQVVAEKARIIRGGGLLEFIEPARMEDVGGLEGVKAWVDQRALGFTGRARNIGLPWPRGMLLVGVQGGGKSLVAKAVAGGWHQPLLRMDVGALMGSLVGQSEGNLRRALAIAERVAPCVLWIDELEKAFGTTQGSLDGGTSHRMLGSLLTWLQERTDPVFVVATSNDISALPPELLRKGRFDETFFVDLPGERERDAIWRVHLNERARLARDPELMDRCDIPGLAQMSDGYTGAEIGAAVVEAAFIALAEDQALDGVLLLKAISSSPPLSKQRAEDIQALRDWARGRARSAE